MTEKPKPINSHMERELDKAEKQLDNFNQQVKDLTLDRMNTAPKLETEPQVPMSDRQIAKAPALYLKPAKAVGSREKFNERFREDYNFQKEYVQFIAESAEIKNDKIEFWTKPFPGCPAEFWEVPPNKPLWAPRYVAEQIKRCSYHRLRMNEHVQTSSDGMGTYTGAIVVDSTIQRLDARPVSNKKSIFMGASGI